MHDKEKLEENKKLVLNFQLAVAKQLQGEPQVSIAHHLSDDITWYLPESVNSLADGHIKQGKTDVLRLFDDIVKRFYDPNTMQFDFHGLFAAEDKVHFHFTLSAITNSGKTYQSGYQMLFQVDNGQIKNVWEYFDSALLLRQSQ